MQRCLWCPRDCVWMDNPTRFLLMFWCLFQVFSKPISNWPAVWHPFEFSRIYYIHTCIHTHTYIYLQKYTHTYPSSICWKLLLFKMFSVCIGSRSDWCPVQYQSLTNISVCWCSHNCVIVRHNKMVHQYYFSLLSAHVCMHKSPSYIYIMLFWDPLAWFLRWKIYQLKGFFYGLCPTLQLYLLCTSLVISLTMARHSNIFEAKKMLWLNSVENESGHFFLSCRSLHHSIS